MQQPQVLVPTPQNSSNVPGVDAQPQHQNQPGSVVSVHSIALPIPSPTPTGSLSVSHMSMGMSQSQSYVGSRRNSSGNIIQPPPGLTLEPTTSIASGASTTL